jgi:hypothetical protein
MDLHEFLLARTGEDEREACTVRERALCRVLRELLAIHRRRPEPLYSWAPDECEGCGTEGDCDLPITEHIDDCPELRILGLLYEHHPEYRAEWAPGAPLVSMRTQKYASAKHAEGMA